MGAVALSGSGTLQLYMLLEPPVFPDRETDAVKGDHGRVLVVGGATSYPNTPGIVALAALRTGVDIVRVAAPELAARRATETALNIMQEPLLGDELQRKHVDTVLDAADRSDVIVIGNGVGRAKASMAAVREIVDETDIPVVVDADGIHAVADDTSVLPAESVMTPHGGEFKALTGDHPPRRVADRRQVVRDVAEELGCTVLLKGATDIVADGDRVETVAAGNPSMTRGGTGDTLAGLTAAFIALWNEPYTAAGAAAELNGTAGDRALEQYGEGYLLEELLDAVRDVVQEVA